MCLLGGGEVFKNIVRDLTKKVPEGSKDHALNAEVGEVAFFLFFIRNRYIQ